jgi:hypothetical protein
MSEEMKPWQRGYPIEHLRTMAAPFKLAYKGIQQGPFGTPKESTIAQALYMKRCVFTLNERAQCVAILLFQKVTEESEHLDFTGRRLPILQGDLLVKDFAFLPGEEVAAVRLLLHMFKAKRSIWFRIPEEYAALKALVAKEAEYIGTKISAYSDVTGFYFRAAFKDERLLPKPMDRSEALSICRVMSDFLSRADRAAIVNELVCFSPTWADHYSSYNKRNSWSAFAIRGYDPQDPNFIIKPAEMSREWKAENPARLAAKSALTWAAASFPKTLEILERIKAPKDRIRFMKLSKGKGELTRHADITDREAGVAPGRIARLHIPIATNPKVIFCSWDSRGVCHRIHMEPNSLYYLDQRKPHTAVNQGDEDRIHLVFDVVSNPELQKAIGEGVVPDAE